MLDKKINYIGEVEHNLTTNFGKIFNLYANNIKKVYLLFSKGAVNFCINFLVCGLNDTRYCIRLGEEFLGSKEIQKCYAMISLYKYNFIVKEVSPHISDRIHNSRLTINDVERILKDTQPTSKETKILDIFLKRRNKMVSKYTNDIKLLLFDENLDERLLDIKIKLERKVYRSKIINDGYKRLEERLKERANTQKFGHQLIDKCFSNNGVLYWPDLNHSYTVARINMFKSFITLYRNEQAHKENYDHDNRRVFELLNTLFIFEREAIPRDSNMA